MTQNNIWQYLDSLNHFKSVQFPLPEVSTVPISGPLCKMYSSLHKLQKAVNCSHFLFINPPNQLGDAALFKLDTIKMMSKSQFQLESQ